MQSNEIMNAFISRVHRPPGVAIDVVDNRSFSPTAVLCISCNVKSDALGRDYIKPFMGFRSAPIGQSLTVVL